jgi:putative hydrolase of the HAD superfamily
MIQTVLTAPEPEKVIIRDENTFIVFDLDDTLYPEIDFLKSGYRFIVRTFLTSAPAERVYREMMQHYGAGENVFEWLVASYGSSYPQLSVPALLKAYREHIPDIRLAPETSAFLKLLKSRRIPAGLVSDGRSISQRNKLKALGLDDYFRDVIISEEFGSQKPHPDNFRFFPARYPDRNFCFIGDNTAKDFHIPFHLGWETICLKDRGQNIHTQSFGLPDGPRHIITSFQQIVLV